MFALSNLQGMAFRKQSRIKILILLFTTICIITSFSSCKKGTRTTPPTANLKQEKVVSKPSVPEADASGFCILTDSIPDVILEIRYFSTYNFVGKRVDGYEEPIALITKEAASALRKVNNELKRKGYRLKIYDTYRPQCAVDHFMRWAKVFDDTLTKSIFYPDLTKKQIFDRGFVATKSSHTRGSTVDLTLVDAQSGKEVDMGGVFDYFGQSSHTDFAGVTAQQHSNRMLLHDAMVRHGFEPIKGEWWHFTLSNEPYPDTYFTFAVKRSAIHPNQ